MLGRRLAASSTRPQLTAGWPALQQAGSSWSGYSSAAAAATASAASEPTTPEQLRQAFSYCVSQVKKHDYENYLWVTQLPKELRAPIFALRAFNVETGMIGEHAKSEMLVLMRFQWWRDAVNDCYKGQPPSQPVVTALAEVLRVAPLTRYRLQQIVSTREEDLLGHAQPASLAAIERYAEGTAGQLLQLQLEAAGLSSSNSSSGRNDDDGGGGGGSSDEDEAGSGGSSGSSSGCSSSGCSSAEAAVAEHAAAHLGKAVGITGLLRGTYAAGAQRRVYLPADLCQQHGVEEQAVLAGRDSEGLRDVTLAVAAAAKQHLDEARRLVGDAPPAARPLFAPAVATGLYLDALEQCGFNLFDQRILRGAFTPLACQLHLKWAQLRGKY